MKLIIVVFVSTLFKYLSPSGTPNAFFCKETRHLDFELFGKIQNCFQASKLHLLFRCFSLSEMAVTRLTLVHVNAVETSYFDFILNMAKESCYLAETFYLVSQTKHILFVPLYKLVFGFNCTANKKYLCI